MILGAAAVLVAGAAIGVALTRSPEAGPAGLAAADVPARLDRRRPFRTGRKDRGVRGRLAGASRAAFHDAPRQHGVHGPAAPEREYRRRLGKGGACDRPAPRFGAGRRRGLARRGSAARTRRGSRVLPSVRAGRWRTGRRAGTASRWSETGTWSSRSERSSCRARRPAGSEALRFSSDGSRIAFIRGTSGRLRDRRGGPERQDDEAWLTGWISRHRSLGIRGPARSGSRDARRIRRFGVIEIQAVSLSGKRRVVARAPTLLIVEDIARDGGVLAAQRRLADDDDVPSAGRLARGGPELAGLLDRARTCRATGGTFSSRRAAPGKARAAASTCERRTAPRRPYASRTARTHGACLRTGSGSSRSGRTGSSSSPSDRVNRGRSGTKGWSTGRPPGSRMAKGYSFRHVLEESSGAFTCATSPPALRTRSRQRDSGWTPSRRTGRSSSRRIRRGSVS